MQTDRDSAVIKHRLNSYMYVDAGFNAETPKDSGILRQGALKQETLDIGYHTRKWLPQGTEHQWNT